jgi:2-polyprenyl-3-methyl-5-hydroxy-6-metoxy-1,4-benzoquinol methylase
MRAIQPLRVWSRFWELWQLEGVGGVWRATKNRLRLLSQHLGSPLYQVLYFVYYQVVFGRSVVGEEPLAALVHAFEHQRDKGDIPQSKARWESQYLSTRWDYMANREEVSRYSVLVGYIQYFAPTGSILDIGCGEGILQDRLASGGYGRYLGIDLSEIAIQKARLKENETTSFIHADAESYVPAELFDLIIFNEVLYYFVNPVEGFTRYRAFLKADGLMLTSHFRTLRAMAIRRCIKTDYAVLAETKITNTLQDLTWFCDVFMPGKKIAAWIMASATPFCFCTT